MLDSNDRKRKPASVTSHTAALTTDQIKTLRRILEERGFEFQPKEYAMFSAKKGKLNVIVYQKGPKVLVQGRETGDFVRFTLEPEVLGEARLGYEEVLEPEMFSPHFGIDESGKGDYFGPLVVAGVFTDAAVTRHLIDAGIMDSKRIGSAARIRTLDAYALWAINRQTSLRLSANNLLADGTRSFSELLPETGAPQSTLNARSNRRSFNAGVLVKF